MKSETLVVIVLALLACYGCSLQDHLKPAEDVDLFEFVNAIYIRSYAEFDMDLPDNQVLPFENLLGKWIRFKGRVKSKDPLPTVGMELYMENERVDFSIRENDMLSNRHDRYEVGKVYTFRVRINGISKIPSSHKYTPSRVRIKTTLSN